MRKNFGCRVITLALWAVAAAAALLLARTVAVGPETVRLASFTVGRVPLDVALAFDGLTALVFVLVTTLGAVVAQYALRYLDGDARQWRFHATLAGLVTAVAFLTLTTNLAVFCLAWLAVSFGLHRLLLLHGDRPSAVYAARKKLLVGRIGDAALLAGCALLFSAFATLDLGSLFASTDALAARGEVDARLTLAGVLLAAGAMTKSVQIPFHFWLPETMETPAPVSALMHAGVINAGGLLVLKMSPILGRVPEAGTMLALCGAATAVFGALVMATQSTIKAKLAYSTISQMGMMMFACGLGAYGIALFHIVAHSLYKAHAFLSTGTLVGERAAHAAGTRQPSLAATGGIVGLAFVALVGGWALTEPGEQPALVYGTVLALGLALALASFPFEDLKERVLAGAATTAVLGGAVALVIAFEVATSQLFEREAIHAPGLGVALSCLTLFAVGAFATRLLAMPDSTTGRRLYAFLWNGGYLGTASTRVLARVWPA